MPMNQPRFIGSANPFVQWAEKYFNGGLAPIPLPPNMKNPPPTGWTGHGRPVTTEQQIAKWMNGQDLHQKLFHGRIDKANIGLRLNTITVNGVEYDLVGIDVDHHPEDKDDPKNGGPQLDYLESVYGKLPPTWTSSARVNGIAGIRFYLAPAGLMWRGDCGHAGPDIDIISKNYRFAVVFPSTNPDANNRQYWWYPPGFRPDGDLESIDRERYGLVPDPTKLPILPDQWIDFLTQGRIKDIGVPMDMDATEKQLTRWALKNFAPHKVPCEYLLAELEKWKYQLDQSAKSHNILTKAHNHLLRCGANEGHAGWLEVVKEFEKAYRANTLARGKRTERVAKKEIERSRFGALRRIKGEADELKEKGHNYFVIADPCDFDITDVKILGDDDDGPPVDYNNFPQTDANPPSAYEMTDWGNAKHFSDLHKGLIHHVTNGFGGWIIWNGSRWVPSRSGIPRALFRRVKANQIAEANRRRIAANSDPAAMKAAAKYKTFADRSGDLSTITRALELASTLQEIEIRQEQLDCDRWALGCANGVVRWSSDGSIELIENTRELLITKNTGVPYIPLAEQKEHKDRAIQRGYLQLGRFLKAVQPDKDRRNYLQKLLGQCLLGHNPHKIAIFLHGPKNTGKTSLLELMIEALGDYGAMRPPRIFVPKDLNPLLATALPMRIIGTDELGKNKIAGDLFKTITGNGSIAVEVKNSNVPVEDSPQFTLIIATNEVPDIPGEDAALRDRLIVIPFEQMVRGASGIDPYKFKETLETYSAPAMLAWLIEGCSRALRENIRPFPDWVIKATGEFSSQLSHFGIFINERVVQTDDPTMFVSTSLLVQAWEHWASENNVQVVKGDGPLLSKALVSQGFTPIKNPPRIDGKQQRGFVGCKVILVGKDNFIRLKKEGQAKK